MDRKSIKQKTEQILNVLEEEERNLGNITGISKTILARDYFDSNDIEQDWEDLLNEIDYISRIQKVFPVDMKEIINKIQKIINE